ncbi:MAG: hypothetical protein ACREQI_13555 [Candidatus Binataceae bacterium]
MNCGRIAAPRFLFVAALAAAVLAGGCAPDYWVYNAAGGGTAGAIGEQHDLPYPAHSVFLLTQDALRGEGVLFEVKPENTVMTLWRDADVPVGVWGGLMGVNPRYRYEIEVLPEGARRSRIVVNVHTEDIPDASLPEYKASTRLALFAKIDRLAAKFPPATGLPSEGGVNFALLPHEDLKALALRVTGNSGNWRQIANDNGLKSATDLNGVASVWVRNRLLSRKQAAPPVQGH